MRLAEAAAERGWNSLHLRFERGFLFLPLLHRDLHSVAGPNEKFRPTASKVGCRDALEQAGERLAGLFSSEQTWLVGRFWYN